MTTPTTEGGADARLLSDNLTPAAEALQKRFGLSRSHSYDLIKNGTIATVRIGARVLVAESELRRFRKSLSSNSSKAA